MQVTAALLADGPAAETLVDLARAGLVHVLGSDSHSARIGRPVRLSDGLERLREAAVAERQLDWIAHQAPAAIVAGQELQPPFSVVA